MDHRQLCHFPEVMVTPYTKDLEREGIRVLDNQYQNLPLKKLDWPRLPGYRAPQGGSDDAFRMEILDYTVKYQKLHLEKPIQAYFNMPSFLATCCSENEVIYHGNFVTRLAGDVATVPQSKNLDYLMIFIDTSEPEKLQYRAIKFKRNSTVIVDAFVAHSFPIPIMMGEEENFRMEVYHRTLEDHIFTPTVEPLYIDLTQICTDSIKTLKIGPVESDLPEPVLPRNFVDKTLKVEHSLNFKRYTLYGEIVEHMGSHHEKPKALRWPGTEESEFHSKLNPLKQGFRLTWVASRKSYADVCSGAYEMLFEGTRGSYDGAEGRPGIEYCPKSETYIINLFSCRPDGTYYIQALDKSIDFVMVMALPNPENDEGVRLHAGVWHSLPVLEYHYNSSAEFKEVVCETNAKTEINIPFECGHGLSYQFVA